MTVRVAIERVCARKPSRSRRTIRKRTERRRWNSTTIVIVRDVRRRRAGMGYTYADASIDKPDRRQAGPSGHRPRCHEPAGGLARDAASRCAISAAKGWPRPRSPRSMLRCGISRRGYWICRLRPCWAATATASRFTAAAVSPPMMTPNSRGSSAAGSSEEGCRWVKMKIGSDPDGIRRASRRPSGDRRRPDCSSMPTAPIGVQQALGFAEDFAAEQDVGWFEEPVSSDDLTGLRRMRGARRPAMEIAAGEYAYTVDYFRQMLEPRPSMCSRRM